MAEIEPQDRVGQNLKTDIKELKRALVEILKAIKEIEEYEGENFIAAGEYLGVKFEA